MPPPVRIEAKAWDDPRFVVMGRLLGIDRDLALIKMARVWAHQTEVGEGPMAPVIIDAITGIDGAAAAAVRAGLAEPAGSGLVRIRGTGDPGRTDWIERRREVSRAGGVARAASALRDPAGRMLSKSAGGNQPELLPAVQPPARAHPETSSALSLSLSLSLRDQDKDLSQEEPARAPLPKADPAGERLADHLRKLLLRSQPKHQLADKAAWAKRRPAWTRALAAIAKARGEPETTALLAWVFGDQNGSEYRFRVDSPKALAEKFDRIEAAMSAPARRGTARSPPRQQPELDEQWGRTEAAAKETR